MAKLYNKGMVPPTGYSYRERATGVWFTCDSEADLRAKVKAHREYKGIQTDTIDKDIEEQMCLRLDDRWCKACDGGEVYEPVIDRTKGMTTEMAFSANRAIISFIKGAIVALFTGKSAWVDPYKSSERANICRGCPFNKPLNGCSCQDAYKAIEAMIPEKRKQPGCHICAACGCSLQAKLNMPDSVVAESIAPGTTFPPWCWQRPLQGIEK